LGGRADFISYILKPINATTHNKDTLINERITGSALELLVLSVLAELFGGTK